MNSELIKNIDKLQTTELGEIRIKRNLSLECDDTVRWCRDRILSPETFIERKGKNWYVTVNGAVITVNAYSYTIITAHKLGKEK